MLIITRWTDWPFIQYYSPSSSSNTQYPWKDPVNKVVTMVLRTKAKNRFSNMDFLCSCKLLSLWTNQHTYISNQPTLDMKEHIYDNIPLGGHPATWWQVNYTGPLLWWRALQFVLLEQTITLDLILFCFWSVRPLPALSSVKLLNMLFTVSHNIASDQRLYSPGRGERQWANAHVIHSYESYHPEAYAFTDWWNGFLMAQLQCLPGDNTFEVGCCVSEGCAPGYRMWCSFPYSQSTGVQYQKGECEKGISHKHT